MPQFHNFHSAMPDTKPIEIHLGGSILTCYVHSCDLSFADGGFTSNHGRLNVQYVVTNIREKPNDYYVGIEPNPNI